MDSDVVWSPSDGKVRVDGNSCGAYTSSAMRGGPRCVSHARRRTLTLRTSVQDDVWDDTLILAAFDKAVRGHRTRGESKRRKRRGNRHHATEVRRQPLPV